VLVFGINRIRSCRQSRRSTLSSLSRNSTGKKNKKQKNKKQKTMKNRIKQSVFGGVLVLATVLLPGSASAVIIDLTAVPTSVGNRVTTADGVVWSQTQQQPTGTGVIKPFLRVQASSHPIEEGYNTSIAPLPMDDLGTADQWVHNVLFATVDKSSGFVKLLLDANQTGSQPLITMSKFVVWRSTAAGNTATTLAALRTELGTPAYDMDASLGNSQVNLAVQTTNGFDANNGSGSGDLYVNIPVSFFGGTGAYLTLYCQFGDGTDPNYVNNDGFEEWAFITGPQPGVPDGGNTLLLLGSALSGLSLITSRRKLARA